MPPRWRRSIWLCECGRLPLILLAIFDCASNPVYSLCVLESSRPGPKLAWKEELASTQGLREHHLPAGEIAMAISAKVEVAPEEIWARQFALTPWITQSVVTLPIRTVEDTCSPLRNHIATSPVAVL